MEKRKLTKADIDNVRHIEGFPIAKDDDIIALSDAPFYTACPNPFVEDFIRENGKPYDEATDNYHREPFAADVSEGKSDPIYNVHSYHTKVPHKAIMRYILHYTRPGDIVFDGFCGTGMTGVAAQMCGSNDQILRLQLEDGLSQNTWGVRYSILADLAPAATFIAQGYNTKYDVLGFEQKIREVLEKTKQQCGWMYNTRHNVKDARSLSDESYGTINYVVWSDVFLCPNCSTEIVYWDASIDHENRARRDPFSCPKCKVNIKKNSSKRAQEFLFDNIAGTTIPIAKQVPVLIVYTYEGRRYQKSPDENDLQLIEKINYMQVPFWFPTDVTPPGMNTDQPRISHGINRVDQFYWKRSLYILSFIRSLLSTNEMFAFTGILLRATKMNRIHMNNYFFGGGGWNAGYLKGTLYVPSIPIETSVIEMLNDRADSITHALSTSNIANSVCITTQSLTDLSQFEKNSIDYIFTDPPFGSNINYSELNFIWEAWLKIRTAIKQEAIINKTQRKNLLEYQSIMTDCFIQCFHVLKPNRWMTVEFHNSKNSVWAAIQEALQRSGFIIADVRTLDKQQGSFKQVTTTSAVKQDLIISAYKPKDSFKRNLVSHAGSEETAWGFVRQHLENLPVVVVKNGKIELNAERQAFLLFDRMVAYHIMNGIPVPLDATDFYKGLPEKFMPRDEMYFLADQLNEYDTARIVNDVEPIQFQLRVTNEKSAIAWLYQELVTPQTYAELQPKFMQESKTVTVDKYESIPELSVLLEDSFLQGEKGEWYIPDRTKEADVAKLRQKKLLKEFEGYMATKGKLKLFRTEAIRVGFAKLWSDKNYQLIVETAGRLPEDVIQEDDKLLMYYDLSLGRV